MTVDHAPLRITDDSTREEIAEALGHMCRAAKREMAVVGSEDHPTPWDQRHRGLDLLLEDYLRAKA